MELHSTRRLRGFLAASTSRKMVMSHRFCQLVSCVLVGIFVLTTLQIHIRVSNNSKAPHYNEIPRLRTNKEAATAHNATILQQKLKELEESRDTMANENKPLPNQLLLLNTMSSKDMTDGKAMVQFNNKKSSSIAMTSAASAANTTTTEPSCALLFFGVPRLFRQAALPSIQTYLLDANPDCDIFVHTYNITNLSVARNNETNGTIVPSDVHMLVPKAAYIENVEQVAETRDMAFFQLNHHKGWGECCSSTENMIKQWHSIDGAWDLMQQYERDQKKTYSRVGLFRLDVFYTHPIYIGKSSSTDATEEEEEAVIPRFLWKGAEQRNSIYHAKFMNDRMFYGDYRNARVWASNRFDSAVKYVAYWRANKKNVNRTFSRYEQGIHSESFMNFLLKDIKSVKKDICFWRLRTTGIILTEDCAANQTILNVEQNKKILSKSMDCCWDCSPSSYNCTERIEVL